MIDKTCIFVVGMHRSGTSALTGLLKILGVELGEQLMEPLADNPKGFFENQRVYELNEEIIKHFGSRWDDPFFCGHEWLQHKDTKSFQEAIQVFLEQEFADSPVFSIKDPRISILFPLWQKACEEARVKPVCILPVRHPMEVARSLEARDGFSLNKGLNLWMNHSLTAERVTRGCPRLFLSFDQLVNEPDGVVERVIGTFGLHDVVPENYLEVIKGFVDKKLKHHTGCEVATDGGAGLVGATVNLLMAACDHGENEQLIPELNELGRRYLKEKDFFLFHDLEHVVSVYNGHQEVQRKLQAYQEDNAMVRKRIEAVTVENAELVGENDRLRQEQAQAVSEIKQMKETLAWRLAEKARRAKNIFISKSSGVGIEQPLTATVAPPNQSDCQEIRIEGDGQPTAGRIKVEIRLKHTPNEQCRGNEAWLLDITEESGASLVVWERLSHTGPLCLQVIDEDQQGLVFSANDRAIFDVPAKSCFQFMKHPWSGILAVTVNDREHTFDLYSPLSGRVEIALVDLIQGDNDQEVYMTKQDRKWLSSVLEEQPEIVAVTNPEWRGVRSSTENLVPHCLLIKDSLNEYSARRYANLLMRSGCTKVLISGFPLSYELLAQQLKVKTPDVEIYVFWHSSFLQSDEDYAWHSFLTMNRLHKEGVVKKLGFAKKGMAEAVARTGAKTGFIANYVRRVPEGKVRPLRDTPHIGLWALAPIWRKTPYAMLAAAAMLDRAKVHVVGQTERAVEFARYFELDLVHREEPVPQDEMPKVLASMDLNLYVTLSECSPMLPLESLAVGVPCLLGPTSHLFEDNVYLHSRLVVPYPDRSDVIFEMIVQALAEREQIIAEYREYFVSYNEYAEQTLSEFIKK
ncbi:hypothetical protein [Desulfogranum marinum]|uniref:hypothetical protein n=1 Tax=Desulfogranum marinum TaxID=453220 RepID=UPI0019645C18|nr:hypothetical protein [Desulfogranum marinum]MBM9513717.1 hypothetical protein [Desulfogranum marinum]